MQYLKMGYIGDSGTGKTGSLASLVGDGFQFKIIDYDNGLDFMINEVRRLGHADKLGAIEYETYRDKIGVNPLTGAGVVGKPTAFTESLKKMTEWSAIEDPNTIFVLDSATGMGRAAFEWVKFMNPQSKDPRQWYHAAQQAVENVIAMVTSVDFKMNVILISHVNYKEVLEGVHKGYFNAIGSALGPTVPKYLNTMVLAETTGSGKNAKRKIKTLPTGVIDLKIATPTIDAELPLETGMSTIFKTLRA